MKRDIIVIGASAGGLEPLRTLFADLPPSFPAAFLVVLHIPPWSPSALPEILTRSGKLPAIHPGPDEMIQNGRVYVAPPDRHMLIESGGRIVLWHGPKENRFRPAINPLFRSAAVTYGPRAVGVILSGALDDGATGLWWIKRYGGIAMVQEPLEAVFPDMPRNAMQHAAMDFVLPVSQLGATLTELANGTELANVPERQSSFQQPERQSSFQKKDGRDDAIHHSD